MKIKKAKSQSHLQIRGSKISDTRRNFLKGASSLGAGLMIPSWAQGLKSMELPDRGEYDFVIVGSGAGGGPLAVRLARRGYHVLVLEAGRDHQDPKVTVPAYHGISTEDDRWSWNYFVRHSGEKSPFSDKDDSKFDQENGGILYPRASAVGGCTIHNSMITMTPDKEDWSHIEKVTGDRSWEARKMSLYFEKLENRRYNKVTGNFHYDELTYGHSEGPWLSTERSPLKHIFPGSGESKFLSAVLANIKSQTGTIPGDTNYYPNYRNGERPEGIYRITAATRAGRRSSPRDWLVETDREFANLRLRTGYFATELTFDEFSDDSTTVKGVKGLYHPDGKNLYGASPEYDPSLVMEATPFEFRAKYEVILAGGAFNTPQLLMLSGIGDAEELDRVGIPMRVNLPGVGKNLQDRYELGVVAQFKSPIDSLSQCTFLPEEGDPCLSDYNNTSESHIYGTNGVLIGNIKKSDEARKVQGAADLFVFGAVGKFKGYESGWSKNLTDGNKNLTWAILKGKTKNTKGYVTLKSKNPHQTPEVNFMNFQEGKESDLKAMMEGVKLARAINNREPLKSLIEDEVWPPKSETTGKALAGKELEQFIMNESWGHHASCTSKMGPRPDDGDVVGSDFKVHKVKGLRIVDASIFPKIPGLFIAAPIYMVSEKAADVITKAYPKV